MPQPQPSAPKVTVAIPTYNRAAFLRQTLAGIAAQRFPRDAFEVLVIDNNSTDKTVEVAAAAGAIVRTERMQGKGNVVRRMFADVEADIYVMADGDATYEAAAAPGLIDL